jgi:hypothetical protein
MEKGFTKVQLQNKLNALKKFNPAYLNFIGTIDRDNAIKRITKKLEKL